MSCRSSGSATLSLIARVFSSVAYSASVPATISASCLIPAMRSSTRPTRLDCTSSTPAMRMTSATALKKMICHERLEIRLRFGPTCAAPGMRLCFAVAIAHAIESFDGIEVIVDDLELLAQPFDVAVDRAVVDIDLVVVSRVHQVIATLHKSGALGQALKDKKLGDREAHRFSVPGAFVALRIEHELAAYHRLALE